jgi:hypothetical protein
MHRWLGPRNLVAALPLGTLGHIMTVNAQIRARTRKWGALARARRGAPIGGQARRSRPGAAAIRHRPAWWRRRNGMGQARDGCPGTDRLPCESGKSGSSPDLGSEGLARLTPLSLTRAGEGQQRGLTDRRRAEFEAVSRRQGLGTTAGARRQPGRIPIPRGDVPNSK